MVVELLPNIGACMLMISAVLVWTDRSSAMSQRCLHGIEMLAAVSELGQACGGTSAASAAAPGGFTELYDQI